MKDYDNGGEKQAPTVEVFDKQERSKHHEMSPVIDSAVDTAFVVHNGCLEWTEKQNAQIITKIKENRQH